MRSFTLAQGLKLSSFANRVALLPLGHSVQIDQWCVAYEFSNVLSGFHL